MISCTLGVVDDNASTVCNDDVGDYNASTVCNDDVDMFDRGVFSFIASVWYV